MAEAGSDLASILKTKLPNLSDEVLDALKIDFPNNGLQKFIDNPNLVDSWKVVSKRSSRLRTNTDALEAISKIKTNPKYADFGLNDELLGQLKGWGYGVDNGASFAELVTDLDKLLTNCATNKITVTNFDKITDVLKSSNNANRK